MTNTPQTRSRAPHARTQRRRIALAILAGGVVLGVGTAVTLAVWNDSEFATGTFASGEFDLEGSTDGAVFSSSPAAPGKTLAFELDADLLSPDAVVYAPFAIQLSAESDYEAAVDLSNVASGDLGADLTYSLYTSTSFDAACSATTPPAGSPVVTDRAADATGAVADILTLTAAEEPINLCFVVAAGDIDQGATGTITWEFAGESGAPLP